MGNSPYPGAIAYIGHDQVVITHVRGDKLGWVYTDEVREAQQDLFKDTWGNQRFWEEEK